ncbi:hypothetical protein SJ05684_c34830 [Sinorhizobium sojae CCBAU 05684]|uniref:Uncharacterized protein n=1 Tax=Sinorhizobium sojae CCBAU 05684 TaxID=716928 RepID=A0A249PHX7_9HYPH|nr:hypothetical protein SJ05684_c34830 [Sinorhizobium sojae CCBAU 05684]
MGTGLLARATEKTRSGRNPLTVQREHGGSGLAMAAPAFFEPAHEPTPV